MKKITLSLLMFAFGFFAYGQTTVTKSYTGPTVSVDGCGTFCVQVGGVTFDATDFPSGCEITDVNMTINWLKTDGSCTSPGTGGSFHNETSFRLDSPAAQVILANANTWSGGADIGPVTTAFDQSAGVVPSGTPVSGTFLPNGGNLNSFNSTNALGTWVLSAGDNAGADPLCVISYSVTVTVADDTTAPTITCPANISVNNDTGLCGAIVTYAAPVGVDNCSSTTVQTAGLASGSEFPVGTTTNTFEVTDGAGLTATCSFDVTVTDTEAPTITCPANISVNNDAGVCGAVVNYTPPVGMDNCGGGMITFSESFVQGNPGTNCGAWTTFQSELLSTYTYSRLTIKGSLDPVGVSVTDPAKVLQIANALRDGLAISLTDGGRTWQTGNCGPGIELSASGSICACPANEYIVRPCIGNSNWGGAGSNTCNAPSQTLTVEFEIGATSTVQTAGLPSGSVFPVGTTTNTFEVTDGAGLTTSCSFDVTVTDTEAPTITCGADIVLNNDAGDCGAVIPSSGSTLLAQFDPVGSHTGAPLAASLVDPSLTVSDLGGPLLTCCNTNVLPVGQMPMSPSIDLARYLDFDVTPTAGGLNLSALNYSKKSYLGTAATLASVRSSLDGFAADIDQISVNPAGDEELIFDLSSLPAITAATSFRIYFYAAVTDNSDWDDLVSTAAGGNGMRLFAASSGATATDNCGIASIVNNFNGTSTIEGATFPVGTTNVLWTATDVNGLTSSCTQVVTVNDTEAPTITCPANIAVDNDAGICGAIVNYTAPVGVDNCTGATTVQTAGLPSGSEFPVGTTTNTFEVTDAAGLTATCSFDVTVTDAEAPTITCPADITVTNDTGICGAVVDYIVDFDDNCSFEYITNGDFETGDLTGWTPVITGSFDPVLIVNDGSQVPDGPGAATAPIDGNFDLLTGQDGPSTHMVSQPIVVPTGVTSATVSWLDRIRNFHTVYDDPNQEFRVELLDATMTPIQEIFSTNPGDALLQNGPNTRSFDLTTLLQTLEGQTVYLSFFQNTQLFYFNVNLDNISFKILSGSQSFVQTAGLPSGSVFPVGITTNTFVVTDAVGLTATCSFDVTVTDDEAPTFTCQDTTVELDANGMVSITPEDVLVNISPAVLNLVSSSGDNQSNTQGLTDFTAPVLTSQTLSFDWSYTTTDGAQFDTFGYLLNGVYTQLTNDGGANNQTGSATVAVTAGDIFGFRSLTVDNIVGAATTTVSNFVPGFDGEYDPANWTLLLTNSDGSASFQTVTAGVYAEDNCGVASLSVSPNMFDCSNVGPNTVTVTVTDVNGNSDTCTAVVTVEDNIAPVALCTPFTAQLDVNGTVTITGADVDGGSTDACGIASLDVSPATFDCSNIGDNTVTLTVTDVNGNMSTCTTIVTVEDNEAPVAVCANIDAILDANGMVSITAADVDGGSTDACGIDTISIDIMDFTCDDIGPNDVTLTVTDVNGNASTCVAVVTVVDDQAPIISCPADVDANTDPGMCGAVVVFADAIALDNCSVTVAQTGGLPSGSEFPVGVSTVQYTATDAGGNTTICEFTITVTDNEPAMAVCQDITVELDATGVAMIVAADVDGGSTDNCGIASVTIDIDTFDCSNVGPNDVTLEVTDVNGNVSTCIAVVTVEDVTAPDAMCMDITVELDATGTVTITGTDVAGASTDACGIDTYELDIDTFDCSNIGENTVTVTITDVNGNASTCTAIVTVEDNISPELVCMDITVELDQDGMAEITAEDVIASNTDNCGIMTSAVDITMFDCSDIGTPVEVQVFTEDSNGNLATCFATVTVVDLLGPVITCPADQTVDPGEGNLFYEVPDYFATGEATVVDNCTDPVTITSQDPAAGDLIPDGVYTVTLTAEDEYGNIGECTFELTVESVLGVGDNTIDVSSIVMYPNPATEYVIISNPQGIQLDTAQIYDVTGRLVATHQLRDMNTEATLPISELSSATYMVLISGPEGQITKQLIKE